MKEQNNSGFFSVIAALIGNIFVTVLKFFGFFVSGSSVMFSEAVHSTADTANQFLLFVGIKSSKKNPTDYFVYGFGRERFFWALISACGVFFIGAGVTVYHGIDSLIKGEARETSLISLVILVIAFLVESVTFVIALKELKSHHKKASFKHVLKEGDPTTIAVVLEDGVAILGVAIAFVSLLLVEFTGWYFWDAIGSILIGLLLGVAAVILITKNRSFLVGKTMPEVLKDQVIELLEKDPLIEKVLDFKSSVLGIDDYRIKCELEFNGTELLDEVFRGDKLKTEYQLIKGDYGEFVRFCSSFSDRIPRLIGRKIDEMEKKIQAKVKGISHIDIELN